MSEPFGCAKGYSSRKFIANYKGPLFPVNALNPKSLTITATHNDPDATLGLVNSAQLLQMDRSVTPNRVNGEASFFAENGVDMLFCNFSGVVVDRDNDGDPDKAFVDVVFTGGTGAFEGATGSGQVEADLHPERGFSAGRIEANVNTPQ